MNDNPIISIIVPVYNSEKYLDRCINSIINQSYKNLDIILIDDGSTDNSGKICEQYAKQDKRIKVFHKKNGGQSSARNLALKYANGEYIGFVDSDDWINLEMYDYLLNILKKHSADLSFIERKKVFSDHIEIKNNNSLKDEKVYIGEDIIEEYLKYGMKTGNYGLPNYLYKKELFQGILFPEGRICEDIVTNFKLLDKAKKIVKSKFVCYYYFQNNISTTRNKFKKKDYDLLFACEELEKITQNKKRKVKDLVFEKKVRSYFSLICKIDRYGIEDSIDEAKELKELILKFKPNLKVFLNSKAPLNRKIIAIIICINNNLLKKIIRKR